MSTVPAVFYVGELVELRSGGPVMTVATGGDATIRATYYNTTSGEFVTVTFNPNMLKLKSQRPAEAYQQGGPAFSTMSRP